jgi:hypothetical protein
VELKGRETSLGTPDRHSEPATQQRSPAPHPEYQAPVRNDAACVIPSQPASFTRRCLYGQYQACLRTRVSLNLVTDRLRCGVFEQRSNVGELVPKAPSERSHY